MHVSPIDGDNLARYCDSMLTIYMKTTLQFRKVVNADPLTTAFDDKTGSKNDRCCKQARQFSNTYSNRLE